MTRDEMDACLKFGGQVMYRGKEYKLRHSITVNVKDLPASNADHYVLRDGVLVDLAELFDPKSNYVFTALAQEVTEREHQSRIT